MQRKTIVMSILALAISAELRAQEDEFEVTLEVFDDVSEIEGALLEVREAFDEEDFDDSDRDDDSDDDSDEDSEDEREDEFEDESEDES